MNNQEPTPVWGILLVFVLLVSVAFAAPASSIALNEQPALPAALPEGVAGLLETGVETWSAGYDSETGTDRVWANVVSPDGKQTYLTGHSWGTWEDIVTIAYDTLTGIELWQHRYNGPGNDWDEAHDLALSPDGSRLFVVGNSWGTGTGNDFVTLVYDAADGALLWEARYDGPASGQDWGNSLAVGPDGSQVYVSGSSQDSKLDYATVAYDAETGDELWVARYSGPGHLDRVNDIAVTPDGSRVTITGESFGAGTGYDYATITYDTETGDELWALRYHGGYGYDYGNAVVADDQTVYVTGQSHGPGTGAGGTSWDWVTIAYDGASGEQAWLARHDGSANGGDASRALVLSPDGQRLFVAGYAAEDETGRDITTIAYDTGTGDRLWTGQYDGPASRSDEASALAVSPDGSRVYVTGWSDDGPAWEQQYDFTTLAYSAETGEPLWEARWENDGGGRATTVTVDPEGGRLFVAGHGVGASGTTAYKTVAYIDLVPTLERVLG